MISALVNSTESLPTQIVFDKSRHSSAEINSRYQNPSMEMQHQAFVAVFEKIASAFPPETPQSVSSSSVHKPTVMPSTSTPVGCCVVTPAVPLAQPASQYFLLVSNHPPPPPPVPTTYHAISAYHPPPPTYSFCLSPATLLLSNTKPPSSACMYVNEPSSSSSCRILPAPPISTSTNHILSSRCSTTTSTTSHHHSSTHSLRTYLCISCCYSSKPDLNISDIPIRQQQKV